MITSRARRSRSRSPSPAPCAGTRRAADPTLEVRAQGASELAVSTDHGLVFLGRTARSGEIEVVAWFGDGPSVEPAVVEPLGDGLYTAETEIRLPAVPLSYRSPRAGQSVLVVGRRRGRVWNARLRVRADDRVEGLLLETDGRLVGHPDQVGAGVYDVDDDGTRRLVGLVSGSIELVDSEGQSRRYLTAFGPERLWRLVTYRRDNSRKRRFVYRDDIL